MAAFLFAFSDAPVGDNLCALVGTSIVLTAVGGVTFWAATGMRYALLRDGVNVASHRAVVATAAGFVAQAVAFGLAAGWLAPDNRGAAIWAYAPAVPLLAPLWLLPRRQA